MLFNKKAQKKGLTIEEMQFKEEQKKNTEELFYKAVQSFDENKTLDCVFFSPFQSWNIRVYLSNLFKNNLLDGNYMKELCKLYGLTFSINFEVEGDYPAVYFFKELNNDKKIKKVK